MFERFSESARQVVTAAQQEAAALRHNYIGTEHLLLGLLRSGGAPAQVLESVGVRLDDVRPQIAQIIGSGDEASSGQIPFTPRSKRVLELSLHEALALRHDHIRPEHLLLGLVREDGGVAARLLRGAGADAESIRAATFAAVNVTPPDDYSRRMSRVPVERTTLRVTPVTALCVIAAAFGVGILVGWAIWG